MTSVRSTRLGGCKAAAFGTLPGYHGQHLREPNVKILRPENVALSRLRPEELMNSKLAIPSLRFNS